jgi:phage replication-related protein YjqB (UPF0714/DUF867 family)
MKTTDPKTHCEIKKAIKHAVRGSGIDVEDDGCPPGFNGDNSKNIVNRLSTKGLQIEQSEKARKCYGIDIADAIADVIGPMIKL